MRLEDGERRAKLVPDTRYRASIELEGIQAMVNNDVIAQKMQEQVGPLRDLAVLGRDEKRTATGVYDGPAREITLPKEVVKLESLGHVEEPTPKPLPKPAPKPAPAPATRTPTQAAQALWQYATEVIRAGHGSTLGTKDRPNTFVRAAQADMRKLDADGVYGDKTRARGKELLGKPFPDRNGTRVPAPVPSAPKQLPASTLPGLQPGQVGHYDQGELFKVYLRENPSTGYQWAPVVPSPTVALVRSEFLPDAHAPGATGFGGQRVFTFRALQTGGFAIGNDPPGAAAASEFKRYSIDVRAVATTAVPKPAPAPAPAPKPAPLPAPPPPASQPINGRTPVQAANDLLAHVTHVLTLPQSQHASGFGYKDHPNATVADAERDMGGLSAPFGIYGPADRARGKELTGKTFPARA